MSGMNLIDLRSKFNLLLTTVKINCVRRSIKEGTQFFFFIASIFIKKKYFVVNKFDHIEKEFHRNNFILFFSNVKVAKIRSIMHNQFFLSSTHFGL